MYATILMDVEDLVDPEADDIAATCANILHEEGVQATLCIVGEKARLLKKRGRQEVVQALSRHDIGFHTDFHSVHPTVTEYLGSLEWEAAVQEAILREGAGIDSIREVFGVNPSCWGGPGNTWSPAICSAMGEFDVPSFVYTHTAIQEGGVHRFAEMNAFPVGRSLSDGDYHLADRATKNLETMVERLREDAEKGVYWKEIFFGHPTRILHHRFWDDPDYANGNNPGTVGPTIAPRKSREELDVALSNFRLAARTIRALDFVELKTIREMNELLAELPSEPISENERNHVWPGIERSLLRMANWPILPQTIDLSNICEQTKSLLPTLRRFEFPVADDQPNLA